MSTPEEVVQEFCAAFATKDVDTISGLSSLMNDNKDRLVFAKMRGSS